MIRDSQAIQLYITRTAAFLRSHNAMTFDNYPELFLTSSDEKDAIIQAEHIIITDINQVICWYRGATVSNTINWYHQFDHRRFRRKNSIPPKNDSRYFGWYSCGQTDSSEYQQLKLLRDMNYVQIEGFFFCDTGRNSISIRIHHPSEFA